MEKTEARPGIWCVDCESVTGFETENGDKSLEAKVEIA